MKRILILSLAVFTMACAEHIIVFSPDEGGSTDSGVPNLDTGSGEATTGNFDDVGSTGSAVNGTSSGAASTEGDGSSTGGDEGSNSSDGDSSSSGGPEPIEPFEDCNPIVDVCTEGHACLDYADVDGKQFTKRWRCTIYDGPYASFGDPCMSDSTCEAIGYCIGAVPHGGCAGAEMCCTVWCDADNNMCPDGRTCVPEPYGFPANVGTCRYT